MHSDDLGALVVVIGLPGSGKTTYMSQYKKRSGYVVVDDYHARAFGNSPDPQWSRHRNQVLDGIIAGQRVMVTDIAFCDRVRLDLFVRYIQSQVDGREIQPDFCFFDCDIDACKHNVAVRYRRDEDGKDRWRFELDEIDAWASRYAPPDDAFPVIRAIGPLAQDAAAALTS